MKNLEDNSIYITAANFFLAFLFFATLFIFALNINLSKYGEAISALQAAIPIAAAWLVLCIANRQLLIDKNNRDDQRKIEVVKSLHYLMVICKDLKAQSGHFAFMLEKEDYPIFPHHLEKLAIGIERRYEEMLHEKDAYRFLSGTTLTKILELSGSIFGMTNLLRSVVFQADITKISLRTVINQLKSESFIKTIKNNDKEIESILNDLYSARNSI